MIPYKHTQIGYLMLVAAFAVLVLFVWVYATSLSETPSVDSGPNFLVTAIMMLTVFVVASFTTLTVSVDGNFLRVKFGYGIFRKRFAVSEIASVKRVKNNWYYGWGIRLWLRPYMWIYNISGFDAVQIIMKNGRIYRIGTDDPKNLEIAIKNVLN